MFAVSIPQLISNYKCCFLQLRCENVDGFHTMYNLPNVDARGMMVHEFCVKEGYCVKYIFQFARITAFCLAGEVLAAVLPLPIPASVYGLLLMVAALKSGLLRLEQVRETGLFLTGIFPLLFVPAAAGVMELGSQLINLLLPAVLAIVPVTALVMAVTGMVAQKCAGGKEHKNG